ncbi:response regulator [Sedimenticola sp.]|uniref:response regulator n=1 Tax=Sedimenticola sp. TaxID=1940285 RepID=UPI00258D6438|nr:response regulator [Sedimenticola sp.]MCW8903262.1 response regulator [Sedimenticola sp.]
MSIPVIICDDSSFARKQVMRALPSGWDVDLTFCENGREAVAAIEAGKGDILLLDLTMPVMDGFQVLKYIRENDLPTLPIVISGDIQPESHKQVMSLGAVAFIKKPVEAAELTRVLDQFGVLGILTENRLPANVQVTFNEWVQEITNVAMGRAADLLVRVINEKVELTIPHVSLMEHGELEMTLNATADGDSFSCITQGFIGGGISGENLLLFHDTDIRHVAKLLNFDLDHLEASTEMELYMDIANVLVGAFLKGFAEQLDVCFSQGHPRITIHNQNSAVILASRQGHEQILTIEVNYVIGDNQIRCNQLVLITPESIDALKMRSGEEVI